MAPKMDAKNFDFQAGDLPLLVSYPHVGTQLPEPVRDRLTPEAKKLPDTDWMVDRLVNFPILERASRIRAEWSRYLVDVNRPPDNENLYPGQPTPEICPTHCFDGTPIYLEESPLNENEISQRMDQYWKPYHRQIQTTLEGFKKEFDFALMLDVHSIASRVPRLFEGQLPDLNIGTFHGNSCGKSLEARLQKFADQCSTYSAVKNGRFVGGYITRHYGDPGNNIHCVQIEISQATYLDESTYQWDEERANVVRPVLEEFVLTLVDWIKK